MGADSLHTFFREYLQKEPFFLDKKALQSQYMPETIEHREEQQQQLAQILAPCLRVERGSNIFTYGNTGAGKTLTIKYIQNTLQRIASQSAIPLRIAYINCKLKRVADTEYRLIAQATKEIEDATGKPIPATGLPTDEVYKKFYEAVDRKEQAVILILDEIDQLIKKVGDGVLYNLIRMNDELARAKLTLIGISNDTKLLENLDPRVKSSLFSEALHFPQYNAMQIQDILRKRSSVAFRQGAVGTGVIEKCSALAARDQGDARRAIDLLRVAGELVEREGGEQIAIKHIDSAEEKIEKDCLVDLVAAQTRQFHAVLYALISSRRDGPLNTGTIYTIYKGICAKVALPPLTQRRVSDIISECDGLGIITINVISKGRYGRTSEICLTISESAIFRISELLRKSLDLGEE